MGIVYRNGTPPKNLPFKKVQRYSDLDFDEQVITQWMRQILDHHVQYDIVEFNGSKGKLNKTIELTVWFQTKIDAERFQKQWMR